MKRWFQEKYQKEKIKPGREWKGENANDGEHTIT